MKPLPPTQEDPSVEVIHPSHLTRQDVLEEYKDVFVGLGRFDPYHITIDDVEPVIHETP